MRSLVMLPGPTNVSDRVMNAMIKPVINHRSQPFHELYNQLQKKAQIVFGTTGEIVVLSSSGTGGVEASVVNLVRRGDDVVVPVCGEFSLRLAEAVEAAGGNVIKLSAPLGDTPRIAEIVRAFESHRQIKALYVVYNETSTGVTFRWLKEAGAIAAKHGAFFVVDAISILGGDELPVEQLGIDICVAGSQKCLAAPPGLAILSVSEKAKTFILNHPPETDYFNLQKYFKFSERGETPFTPALPLFYALDEALTLVIEEGLPARIDRHRRMAAALYSGFASMGLEAFPKEDVRSNTVVTIQYPPGIEDRAFREILEHRFRILVAGGFGELKGRTFRVGCMGEVSEYHVATTLLAISAAFTLLGRNTDVSRALRAAFGSHTS